MTIISSLIIAGSWFFHVGDNNFFFKSGTCVRPPARRETIILSNFIIFMQKNTVAEMTTMFFWK